jgi:plastocyanin
MTNLRARYRWQPLAATAMVLALLLVGIRGAEAATGATATASKVATVKIADFAFKPATQTIAKGGKVTFSNSTQVTHTATRAGAFDTGLIKPGKSVTVRFKQKGTFAYHCEIHPFMHGKIVVE